MPKNLHNLSSLCLLMTKTFLGRTELPIYKMDRAVFPLSFPVLLNIYLL